MKKHLGKLTKLSVSFWTVYTVRRSLVTFFFMTILTGSQSGHMIFIFGSNVIIATSSKMAPDYLPVLTKYQQTNFEEIMASKVGVSTPKG